jgi:UDP-2-acetamido-3-amino-2,3-dideoxy-glucuronate N-acetyltransferase
MIHPTADIDPSATVNANASVWRWVVVRECAIIGANVSLGDRVYIGPKVMVLCGTRIGNGAQLFGPCNIGSNVFIGPGAMLINDAEPRVNSDWVADSSKRIFVHKDASIGAGAIIFPGVIVGAGAMVGAGAVVREDVQPGATVVGVPARLITDH